MHYWPFPLKVRLLRNIAVVCGVVASVAASAGPQFDLPIRCELGRECFIQNYFDHDPESGYTDYRCGHLSYDGHKGTDFRVPHLKAMHDGVEVLAAAAGTVVGTRDGEPDLPLRIRGKENLNGKDAGNAVRIDHGDGWETQYSHLRRGSVLVRKGQTVQAGDVLGYVGLSGRTDFPHVDLTVRHLGQPVDPFAVEQSACGKDAPMLWSSAARNQLAYQPTGLLWAGFSTVPPTREVMEAGDATSETVAENASLVSFWVELFGLNKNDRWSLMLFGPEQQLLARKSGTIASDMAVWYVAISRPRGTDFWPHGIYRGHFQLERDGMRIVDEQRTMPIR